MDLSQLQPRTPIFSAFSHGIAILTGLAALYMVLYTPEFYLERFVAKDSATGTGIAEHLTWIILIPGILAGFYALLRYPKHLMGRPGLWLFAWTAACIYFAGEEASWGQWYFLWETPEAFQQINDQQETNLHNTSSWLDQKPRLAVEIWIFLGGFIWPLLRYLGLRPMRNANDYRYWIAAPQACFSAALLFTLVRISDWIPNDSVLLFANSEFRELTIALFLTLFLCSFAVRLRRLPSSHAI